MEYKTLKEFCIITKGKTGIMKAIPGKFPLVVTSEERKTHNEFQFDAKAVIVPLVSGTGHGHASIKRIHYQEGKFALGTILCAIIPKNENVLNAQFLYHYLNLVKEKELVGRMKGMANVTLPIKEIEKVLVPILTIDEQLKFVEFYTTLKNDCNTIDTELTHQLSLISQLRQAFLKEAMQGKLVSNETSDGKTGADLLSEIQTEKEKLIKEKKIKKQKPLPPISEKEIPFHIPENWVWCRLGEVGELKRGKSKHRPRNDKRLFIDGFIPFIQTGDVSRSKYSKDIINTVNGYYNDFGLSQSELQKKGTLCITIAANIAESGFLGIDACLPDSIVCFESVNKNTDVLVNYFIKLSKTEIEKYAPATAQKNINLGILNDLYFPLPPLEIQNRIVSKLEELMTYCDDLETSVKESQNHNEQLLQQVLREALAVKEVVES